MRRETLSFGVGFLFCVLLCLGSALWVWTLALNFDDWIAPNLRRHALLALAALLPLSLGGAAIASILARRYAADEVAAVIVWPPLVLFLVYAFSSGEVFIISLVDTIADALGFTYMHVILI